jgi:hypothetical protein
MSFDLQVTNSNLIIVASENIEIGYEFKGTIKLKQVDLAG